RLAGPIAQPDLPGQLARLVDRGDAHVVAADAQSAGLWGIAYITPTLQALVPVIRQCIDILPFLVREPGGRRDQRADGHCQREWTDAGVFLPAILIAGRSRTHDEPDGGADHLGRARKILVAELAQLRRDRKS